MNETSKWIVALIIGLITGVTGSVFALDARYDERYVGAQQFDSFYDDYLFNQRMNWKKEIRRLRNELLSDPDNPYIKEDLQEYLDKLCDQNMGDRECSPV